MASRAPPGLTGAPPGLAGAPPGLMGASAGAPPGPSASGGSVSAHLRSKAVSLPDGTVRTVGLVDAHWADPPLDLPAFLPADGAADAPVDAALEWAEVRSAMTDGVDLLLSLPLGQFWSRVLYDEGVLRFVDSMLRFAPRERRLKAADAGADGADADADDALLRRCLLLLRRLSTCHESESEYLDDEFWRESVYERWVFDAPKLIDLAAIYGFTNTEIVRAIVADVLRMQPRRAPRRAPTPPTPPPPHHRNHDNHTPQQQQVRGRPTRGAARDGRRPLPARWPPRGTFSGRRSGRGVGAAAPHGGRSAVDRPRGKSGELAARDGEIAPRPPPRGA